MRPDMDTPRRQRRTIEEVGHRPYPLPTEPWVMAQTWLQLLFAHWPIPAGAIAPLIPAGLELDTWEASAWLTVSPFAVQGLRPRLLPPLPRFLETNVRTYVRRRDRPGILFFSLDATSRTAVQAARFVYRLPYLPAAGNMTENSGDVSSRIQRRRGGDCLLPRYTPAGPAAPAAPGTLEHFLAERYCFFTRSRGRLLRCEIHHPPWPLAPADAELSLEGLLPPSLPPPTSEPLFHYAARQDVVAWRPMRA